MYCSNKIERIEIIMTYRTWIQEVNKSLKGTLNIVGLNVDKFPAIDFKKMYKVGFAPETASQTAKAIHRYLNRDYRGF